MKTDLYKAAISSEQEALSNYISGVNVELKDAHHISKSKITMIILSVAAVFILALTIAIPNRAAMELKRADRLMAKIEMPVSTLGYHYDIGKSSSEKFNQKISRINEKHTLIRKFNSMIDKYEQKN